MLPYTVQSESQICVGVVSSTSPPDAVPVHSAAGAGYVQALDTLREQAREGPTPFYLSGRAPEEGAGWHQFYLEWALDPLCSNQAGSRYV